MARLTGRGLVIVLALTVSGVACGSDKSDQAKTATPEDRRAPAAQVATGLAAIGALSQQIATAATTDARGAKELAGRIEPAWQPIEGTIRANDQDTYLTFEDDFAGLEKAAAAGDGPKAQQMASAITEAVKTYLTRYPG